MNSNMKNKGFTLVELMVTLAIAGILMLSMFWYMNFSVKLSSRQKTEIDLQYDTRDAMLRIEEEVKKSKAIFAVPAKEFQGGTPGMDEKWDYIGVATKGKNKDKVCYFSYDNKNKKWKERLITDSGQKLKYKLEFKKDKDEGIDQKKITYTLTSTYDGDDFQTGKDNKRDLTTKTEVLNAFTVIDRGTKTEPAVAIAIKKGEIDFPTVGSVTFVVDLSASMKMGIQGQPKQPNWFSGNSRSRNVTDAIKNMITEFKEQGLNTNISVVGFAAVAKKFKYADGSTFKMLNDSNYKEILDRMEHVHSYCEWWEGKAWGHQCNFAMSYQEGGSGTNIGDGLRLAYNSIKANTYSDIDLVVLITDGLPGYSVVDNSNGYYFGNENIVDFYKINYNSPNIKKLHGNESKVISYKTNSGTDDEKKMYENMENSKYAAAVGDNFYSTINKDLKDKKLSYLITVGDLENAIDGKFAKACFPVINKGLGNEPDDYFKATTVEELNTAMREITESFVSGYWSISGPKK